MRNIPIQAIENIRLAHTWETWATLSSSERTQLIYLEIKRLDQIHIETPRPVEPETPYAQPVHAIEYPSLGAYHDGPGSIGSWPRPWRDG